MTLKLFHDKRAWGYDRKIGNSWTFDGKCSMYVMVIPSEYASEKHGYLTEDWDINII